jgi:hypothetical protein
MSDAQISIQLYPSTRIHAGATAYAPLPVDPFEERAPGGFAGPRPAPRPAPAPSGPAYPSLPIEPDTKDGGGGGTNR